jgi:hypothetical protein
MVQTPSKIFLPWKTNQRPASGGRKSAVEALSRELPRPRGLHRAQLRLSAPAGLQKRTAAGGRTPEGRRSVRGGCGSAGRFRHDSARPLAGATASESDGEPGFDFPGRHFQRTREERKRTDGRNLSCIIAVSDGGALGTDAEHPAEAWTWPGSGPSALAERLLRRTGALRSGDGPFGERPSTGKPDAGNPPVRLGGRGSGATCSPCPIRRWCWCRRTHGVGTIK